MSNFRDGYLEQGRSNVGRLDVLLSADNQKVDVGVYNLLNLYSDNATATNRTFTLYDGAYFGQVLTILFASATNSCDLQATGNVKMAVAWQPVQWDNLVLVWDGTYWNEMTRGSPGSGSIGAALASAKLIVGSAGGVATARTITGDVTIGNTGVTAIASDVIVDGDINSAAGISFSKLATLASTNILVGSAGGVATSVTVTGDVTIGNTGVTAIGAGKVLESMIGATTGNGKFVQRYAKAIFDATGGINTGATTLSAAVPANSFIDGAWYWVKTTFTSAADTATIALSIEGANDVVSAIAIGDVSNPWDSTTLPVEGIPKIETTSTWLKTTQARSLTATVAVQALTAGVLYFWVRYWTIE